MEHEIKSGSVLIKDDALLPKALHFKGEPFVPGWTIVKDLEASALDREIQRAGWTFLWLAGEGRSSAFGMDGPKTLHRAVEGILARGKSHRFNSLEITQVAFKGSVRFPMVRYVTVSAHWRHIQQGVIPFRTDDLLKSRAQGRDVRRPWQQPAV
ncbi:MAG: hypothetical protein ACRD40_00155 [Candidatus Acidiferrales bacterium]